MRTILDLESIEEPIFGAKQIAAIRAIIGDAAVATPENLASLEGATHVIVTGSAAMVADTPWAKPVASAIEAAARQGANVLAVCFGHQLMAWHFGGRLGSFETIQRGVQSIAFDGVGPFPAGTLDVLHSHRDHVVDPGALEPIGSGGFGGIAALRHPDLPIWTCQGHPEWDEALARAVSPDWRTPPRDTPGTHDILLRFVGQRHKTPDAR